MRNQRFFSPINKDLFLYLSQRFSCTHIKINFDHNLPRKSTLLKIAFIWFIFDFGISFGKMQDTNVNNFLHQKAKNKLVYLLRTVVKLSVPRALDSALGKKGNFSAVMLTCSRTRRLFSMCSVLINNIFKQASLRLKMSVRLY